MTSWFYYLIKESSWHVSYSSLTFESITFILSYFSLITQSFFFISDNNTSYLLYNPSICYRKINYLLSLDLQSLQILLLNFYLIWKLFLALVGNWTVKVHSSLLTWKLAPRLLSEHFFIRGILFSIYLEFFDLIIFLYI